MPCRDNIYMIPRALHEQGLDDIVVKRLHLTTAPADLHEWDQVVNALQNLEHEVTVAMVGKYIDLVDSYKSLTEALTHAAIHTRTRVHIVYVDSEEIETSGAESLRAADAILVPGGFGNRGIEGKIAAVRYARENNVPYLGICLGMQVAVIEYARNVVGLEGANSTEFDQDCKDPVIALITEWQSVDGQVERRDGDSDKGGTMRLGGQECKLLPGSRVQELYGRDTAMERHRHRYEFNNRYREKLESAGLRIAGLSVDEQLVEIVEIPGHPWFIACQFHPEFTSTPRDGHPLFTSFINAALVYHDSESREIEHAVV